MPKPEKMTVDQIVYAAITWAEESMLEMIGGCPPDDTYRAEVLEQLRQMRAYKKRRYGKPKDPFDGAKLVDVIQLRKTIAEQQS